MTVQTQLRTLTTRRRHSDRNRQSSMVVRAAVELGLDQPLTYVEASQN
jgi:hypothetical protein